MVGFMVVVIKAAWKMKKSYVRYMSELYMGRQWVNKLTVVVFFSSGPGSYPWCRRVLRSVIMTAAGNWGLCLCFYKQRDVTHLEKRNRLRTWLKIEGMMGVEGKGTTSNPNQFDVRMADARPDESRVRLTESVSRSPRFRDFLPHTVGARFSGIGVYPT